MLVDYRARTIEGFVLEEGTYALLDKSGVGGVACSKVLAGFEVVVDEVFAE